MDQGNNCVSILERICNVFNRRSRYLHSKIGFLKVGTRFPVASVVSQLNGEQKLVGRMLKGRMQFQGRKIAWVFERSRTNTARVGRVLMELEILNKPAGLQPVTEV